MAAQKNSKAPKKQESGLALDFYDFFHNRPDFGGDVSHIDQFTLKRDARCVVCDSDLVIIAIGIVFDIIGVAVTAADEKPFHSMASRKVPEATQALKLDPKRRARCRRSATTSSAISAASFPALPRRPLPRVCWQCIRARARSLLTLAMSALAAGLTVGGKACGKSFAIDSSTSVVRTAAMVLAFFPYHSLKNSVRNAGGKAGVVVMSGTYDFRENSYQSGSSGADRCRTGAALPGKSASFWFAMSAGPAGIWRRILALWRRRLPSSACSTRKRTGLSLMSVIRAMFTSCSPDAQKALTGCVSSAVCPAFRTRRRASQTLLSPGTASNAVSVALGMARARTLEKQDYSVIALVGDGALTGGLAYEGLNNAGASRGAF